MVSKVFSNLAYSLNASNDLCDLCVVQLQDSLYSRTIPGFNMNAASIKGVIESQTF